MNHHKTNTLRLNFLLNSLRSLIRDDLEEARGMVARDPRSRIQRQRRAFYEELEIKFEGIVREMEKIKWVEPDEPAQPEKL